MTVISQLSSLILIPLAGICLFFVIVHNFSLLKLCVITFFVFIIIFFVQSCTFAYNKRGYFEYK